jgi:hypothetical protein
MTDGNGWIARKHYPSAIDVVTEQQRRDGIWYRRTRPGKITFPLEADEIHWRPGDPNPLAAAIIKKVRQPTILDLNGHRYTITPQDAT